MAARCAPSVTKRGGNRLTWHCMVMSMSLRSKNLPPYFSQTANISESFQPVESHQDSIRLLKK